MPILQITGEYDHLVPSEASLPFNEVVGSDDVESIHYSTGHIGLSVSSSSHENVWPEVSEWYAAHQGEADGADAADGGGDAGTEDAGAPDVETVDGIGPTYADRLREAGIETVDDLADYDDAELADIAQAPESRVEDWFDAIED